MKSSFIWFLLLLLLFNFYFAKWIHIITSFTHTSRKKITVIDIVRIYCPNVDWNHMLKCLSPDIKAIFGMDKTIPIITVKEPQKRMYVKSGNPKFMFCSLKLPMSIDWLSLLLGFHLIICIFYLSIYHLLWTMTIELPKLSNEPS